MRAAIVHPNSILGQAVQERVQRSSILQLHSLLTTRENEFGTLGEAGESAALTQELKGDEADVYFVCGAPEEQARVAKAVRSGVLIHVEPTADRDAHRSVAGESVVLDNGSDDLLRLRCPSPIAVALTHLLRPIADLQLSASVVALRGASSTGAAALDELLEQTRSLLSFSGEMPTQALETQLAFNAVGGASADDLERELDGLLPECRLCARLLEVGIFHGVGLAVDLTTQADQPAAELVREVQARLADAPYVEAQPADTLLGTVDAAGSDGILLAAVQQRQHGVGLWAVFDNLTLAARNAVDLAENLPDRWLKVN